MTAKEDLDEVLWQYTFSIMIQDLLYGGYTESEIKEALLKEIDVVCKKWESYIYKTK